MTNRAHRRVGERPEFTRADAVLVLRDTLGAYQSPPTFTVGQVLQAKHHFEHWSGYERRDKAPIMLLEVFPDLGAITGEAVDRGVEGVKIAVARNDESVTIELDQAWRFEPYTGPMPDEH